MKEKMTDIIIYTTGDVLLHKQGKLPDDDDYFEGGYVYWHFNRTPRRLKEGDKIKKRAGAKLT